jgi:hypothetical protein
MGAAAAPLSEDAVEDAVASVRPRWVVQPDQRLSDVPSGPARRRAERARGRLLAPEIMPGPRWVTMFVSGLGKGDLGRASSYSAWAVVRYAWIIGIVPS